MEQKLAKTQGRPFRVYRATLPDLQKMAGNLIQLHDDPVVYRRGREPLRLGLIHPLFDMYLVQLHYLATLPLDAVEEEN